MNIKEVGSSVGRAINPRRFPLRILPHLLFLTGLGMTLDAGFNVDIVAREARAEAVNACGVNVRSGIVMDMYCVESLSRKYMDKVMPFGSLRRDYENKWGNKALYFSMGFYLADYLAKQQR